MSAAHLTLPHPKESAQRQYVEQFGSVLVMNTYLKIAVLALSLVCLGLVALNIKTYQAFRNLKPLVIRINDVGRAEAVRYETLEYRPQEAEIKYFLTDFASATTRACDQLCGKTMRARSTFSMDVLPTL
jgi:type IV secretory pathway TrbF-like protein